MRRSQRLFLTLLLAGLICTGPVGFSPAQGVQKEDKKEEKFATEAAVKKLDEGVSDSKVRGDSAWMMVSTAFVMLMVPGLALFYGGMVRRKNILATMMHSMVALAIVGVFWIGIGYSLAFGDPWIFSRATVEVTEADGSKKQVEKVYSYIGYSPELVFMQGVKTDTLVPGLNIPVYLHMLFQGMFAIITPALISGAMAERIRFKPYCLFIILWATLIYCPLAHWVWAANWDWAKSLAGNVPEGAGGTMVGWLGALGALDFAGGTVVHIAAGFSSLAAILVLRRRKGYPEQAFHPSSMVLTLTGAGLLWFGWFGFNGGSAGGSGPLAVSAFAATQAAAASAGLAWLLVEWLHKGKPTALGLASGIVAGLVAVTPASGYVYVWGGLLIGVCAGIVCYLSVAVCKPLLGYDDSLDAFGVHGVGGFLGAVLTGVFCYALVNSAGSDGWLAGKPIQVYTQTYAAVVSAVLALLGSLVLVGLVHVTLGFTTDERSEVTGLDNTEHGESGFDLGYAMESSAIGMGSEPRAASVPPAPSNRFSVVVSGAVNGELMKAWSDLCLPGKAAPPEFKAVYPYMTTVQGNRFNFRGGEPEMVRLALQSLFKGKFKGPIQTHVERY